MSNTKQTAVEWYAIELANYLKDIYGDGIVHLDLLKKAKAMEKEQMIDAILDNRNITSQVTFKDTEQYYKETYRGDTIQNKQERMYSAEEVIKIVEKSRATGLTAEYLIEQFKHKQV